MLASEVHQILLAEVTADHQRPSGATAQLSAPQEVF